MATRPCTPPCSHPRSRSSRAWIPVQAAAQHSIAQHTASNHRMAYTPVHAAVLPPSLSLQPSVDPSASSSTEQYRRLLDLYHECVSRGHAERARRAYSLLLRSGRLDWATDWREGLRNITEQEDRARFLRETLNVHSRKEHRSRRTGTSSASSSSKREVGRCKRELREAARLRARGKGYVCQHADLHFYFFHFSALLLLTAGLSSFSLISSQTLLNTTDIPCLLSATCLDDMHPSHRLHTLAPLAWCANSPMPSFTNSSSTSCHNSNTRRHSTR